MNTLAEYLAEQRARKADYQRQYRERVKTDPKRADHARVKNAEHQRRYRDRVAAQRIAEHRACAAAHADLISRYCAAHPGASTVQAADALRLSTDEHTIALQYLSGMLG